jgi:hypothetical protein
VRCIGLAPLAALFHDTPNHFLFIDPLGASATPSAKLSAGCMALGIAYKATEAFALFRRDAGRRRQLTVGNDLADKGSVRKSTKPLIAAVQGEWGRHRHQATALRSRLSRARRTLITPFVNLALVPEAASS